MQNRGSHRAVGWAEFRYNGRVAYIEEVGPIDETLAACLAEIWVAVAENGGAVGVVPPYMRTDVEDLISGIARAAANGTGHVLLARTPSASDDPVSPASDVVGWVLIARNERPIVAHWAWLKHLMVLPTAQGRGLGTALVRAAETMAFDALGLEAVYLTCRSGTGLEGYYVDRGYVVVGRMPGNLRLSGGERRDEIYLVRKAG